MKTYEDGVKDGKRAEREKIANHFRKELCEDCLQKVCLGIREQCRSYAKYIEIKKLSEEV